eukprot:7118341-Pyramimonas_sp.AAC.1
MVPPPTVDDSCFDVRLFARVVQDVHGLQLSQSDVDAILRAVVDGLPEPSDGRRRREAKPKGASSSAAPANQEGVPIMDDDTAPALDATTGSSSAAVV